MMKYKLVWICCVLAFAKAEFTKAQTKQKLEQEEKIAAALFPDNAVKVVNEIGYARKKVTYYRETDGDKISYEAKLKFQDRKYSIEFDLKGVLEDVEIDSRKRNISKNVRSKINKTLDTVARKYRIEKVQEQYVAGDQSATKIKERIARKDFDNFEVIVAFKNKRKIYRKEYLFDKNGSFISQRDVKRLEYDFLLF